jgi:hypothetical protein
MHTLPLCPAHILTYTPLAFASSHTLSLFRDSQGDFPAAKMINSVHNVDPERKARLIKVLDIDPSWRMHQVSDGQRRRVQIGVGLLKPFKVWGRVVGGVRSGKESSERGEAREWKRRDPCTLSDSHSHIRIHAHSYARNP